MSAFMDRRLVAVATCHTQPERLALAVGCRAEERLCPVEPQLSADDGRFCRGEADTAESSPRIVVVDLNATLDACWTCPSKAQAVFGF